MIFSKSPTLLGLRNWIQKGRLNMNKIRLNTYSKIDWILHHLSNHKKVRLSKSVYGIFDFRFRFVFIKIYIFVQQKAWKATYSYAPRPLIFKLQQEVLKFNDICLSWSSAKTDLERSFLNLENRSFENVSFSQ